MIHLLIDFEINPFFPTATIVFIPGVHRGAAREDRGLRGLRPVLRRQRHEQDLNKALVTTHYVNTHPPFIFTEIYHSSSTNDIVFYHNRIVNPPYILCIAMFFFNLHDFRANVPLRDFDSEVQ